MTTFREHLKHQLETDPEFKKEWEAHEDCRRELQEQVRWTIKAQQLAIELMKFARHRARHDEHGYLDRLARENEWLEEEDVQPRG